MAAGHGWSLEAELIEGEAVVIPPDGPRASLTQVELLVRLRHWQDGVGDGGLLLASVFVRINERTTLGPDLAWWSADRRPSLDAGQVTVVPDWVAEVLSPSTRANDLGPKRESYLAAGVRELWLVDPATRSVTVVDAGGRSQDAGAVIASRVLPGLTVRTDVLWTD